MAYSNKALPPGTVLREWRLEEVLGVGGFGIVYKGRGIYFDELVAIKEYFPSAISDRKDGDTVVPIDSEAEEVHALGLKKFVEEAKLLWNLSTPSRHPNIVSVRSLFEIHGTAYMVMDFEDGLSLSKLLKQGRRFNEASLMALLQPIAEGLERAHRVGVLHRDIKPPNILVNDDGRPVLIDFGSARFEAADATSTKVTFHTPPYAAIEQYVKTYPQGPWTDVYALGVVLYECVTGQKPPEVLERMHAGLGSPLADGEWPGYSHTFLKAIDTAMIVRPGERPQSITEWLALFTQPDGAFVPAAADDDETARFVTFDTQTRRILPVAPPPPGFERAEHVDTPVPDSVSQVEFKQVGEDTNARKKLDAVSPPFADEIPIPASPASPSPPIGAASSAPKTPKSPSPPKPGGSRLPLLIGSAAVLAGAGLSGWYLLGSRSPTAATDVVSPVASQQQAAAAASAAPLGGLDSGGVSQALQALADEARKAGAPADAVNALTAPIAQTGPAGQAELPGLAKTASAGFAKALLGDADRRTQRVVRQLPSADRRGAQARLQQARSAIAGAVGSADSAADPAQALAAAQRALAGWRNIVSAQAKALAAAPSIAPDQVGLGEEIASPSSAAPFPATTSASSSQGVSAGKVQQLAGIVSSSKEVADKVIKMGRVSKPGSRATDDEKDNYRTLQQNAQSAQGYVTYLDTLTNSMRGAKNDRDADRLIAQGEQTKRYLLLMLSRSTAASR